MARSPFQGTFIPNIRQTVVTAPDAIVYLNGESEVVGCPSCSRAFNFNKYITSIQTDLSVDGSPGSASITLSIPRHTIDDFYFDGTPVLTAMMEVEIFAKGYYLVEGLPQYYPIFWGMITEVGDNYSGGEHTVTIQCADILKWWEICQMNINPAYTAPSGQGGRDVIKGNVFSQMNPYDIIFTLALQSMGDIITATGSLNVLAKDQPLIKKGGALTDVMVYWNKRFQRMRSNLVLFGAQGVAVRGDTLYAKYHNSGQESGRAPRDSIASDAVRLANGGPRSGSLTYDATSSSVTPYRFVTSNAGQIDLWQSEYQTKLEIANAAKEAIGFEFYMDVTGDLVFKPPFYNLDILSNKPMSWVQDIDIIDWDFSESEAEVVTQLVIQGQAFGTTDYGTSADMAPFTSVTDYHLLRKYGWRSKDYNSEFMSSPLLMFYHGMDVLDRINSTRHRGTVTIPMRSELRLGFPIYIAPKDQVWYVTGISHSISFGSRATTSLTLTAKRSKFIAIRGIGEIHLDSVDGKKDEVRDGQPRSFRYSSRELSEGGKFTLKVGSAGTTPPSDETFQASIGADNPYEPLVLRHPKTGRIVGYPNVVMCFTRPFTSADISNQAGQKPVAQPKPQIQEARQAVTRENLKANNEELERNVANAETDLNDKYMGNRYQYGLNSAGVYIYAHDSSAGGGVISELLLLDSKMVDVTPKASNIKLTETSMIRPVSDERGFEVIGHYQYGRRLSLRDGRLVVNGPNATKATVDLQLGLSGGLSEVLIAQSQGLTTVYTGFANPAATLTEMTPDERQTAAIISPDVVAVPEFVDVGDNFIDNAPLGSEQQVGAPPSVEATQLSRALTLTEMGVKDENSRNDEDCVCLTGRADLAFMNVGYQVKVLSGVAETDNSGLFQSTDAAVSEAIGGLNVGGPDGGPIQAGRAQQLERNVAILEARLALVDEQLAEATAIVIGRFEDTKPRQATIDRLTAQSESIKARLSVARTASTDALAERTYEGVAFSSNPLGVISKVDQFLVNLYKALDTPHQELESALRGDLLPGQTASALITGDQSNPPSKFAPPFSAPNRFQLGDVKAAIGAVNSNAAGITKAWSEFGDKLRVSAEASKLNGNVSRDVADISRLQTQVNSLKKQQATNASVVGVNLTAEIKWREDRIADLQKEVLNNRTKLATL